MPAYIPITEIETDPEAPLTSELAKKWRDNPIAIVEGASGAPKIALPAYFAAGGTVSFVDLDDFAGLKFEIQTGINAGGSDSNVSFFYSTDNGSSWSAGTTIGTVLASGAGPTTILGTFDFSSGAIRALIRTGTGGSNVSTTVSGASLSINAVRFSGLESTGAAIIYPNGGII